MTTARIDTISAAIDSLRRTEFGLFDILRRAYVDIIGAIGFDPDECPYATIISGLFWRLRDYGPSSVHRSLLVIAAPIKRPYIWDLTPRSSVIRYCLGNNLHVYLLEWLPAQRATSMNGFIEYVTAIGKCVAEVSRINPGSKPILIGHSLGGTLAVIFGAVTLQSVRGLVLLGAPLCFAAKTSRFRDALVSLLPTDMAETEPYPGSLVSHVSALASPDTFIWARLQDSALSLTSGYAMEVHAHVTRWSFDEVPLPGKLVHQLVDLLYRQNRLFRGTLKIGASRIGPFSLSVPTLAVVNTADDIAPLQSVKPFIDECSAPDTRIIEYPGENGVCLQHLAILLGRKARARVWPEIISWIEMHSPET